MIPLLGFVVLKVITINAFLHVLSPLVKELVGMTRL